MTVYDDMRGFIHAHDRNGRFDVATETTPMYQMVDKAAAENANLRELVSLMDKRDVLLPCWRGCNADCRFYGSHCERIGTLMGELGF